MPIARSGVSWLTGIGLAVFAFAEPVPEAVIFAPGAVSLPDMQESPNGQTASDRFSFTRCAPDFTGCEILEAGVVDTAWRATGSPPFAPPPPSAAGSPVASRRSSTSTRRQSCRETGREPTGRSGSRPARDANGPAAGCLRRSTRRRASAALQRFPRASSISPPTATARGRSFERRRPGIPGPSPSCPRGSTEAPPASGLRRWGPPSASCSSARSARAGPGATTCT